MKISTLLLFTALSVSSFAQGLKLDSIAFKKTPLWEPDESYGLLLDIFSLPIMKPDF